MTQIYVLSRLYICQQFFNLFLFRELHWVIQAIAIGVILISIPNIIYLKSDSCGQPRTQGRSGNCLSDFINMLRSEIPQDWLAAFHEYMVFSSNFEFTKIT